MEIGSHLQWPMLCHLNVEATAGLHAHPTLGPISVVTGTFVPTYFHSRERKFHGWNFRSLELSLPGTFVPWNFRPLELSLPRAKIT